MSSIATRFAIAVHVLTLLDDGGDAQHSSEWMAGSIGVNPVIVRSVMGQLRKAGLVHTHRGVAGAHLARPLDRITLLDVQRAVEPRRELFGIHHRPNPACPVGAHIQQTLECFFGTAQRSMQQALAGATLADVVADVHRRIGDAGGGKERSQ